MENNPDIVAGNKADKEAVVIGVAAPLRTNIRKKEHKKLESYPNLREQLERMWGLKSKWPLWSIGAFWALTPKLEEWFQ